MYVPFYYLVICDSDFKNQYTNILSSNLTMQSNLTMHRPNF